MFDFEYKVYDEVLEAMKNKTKNIEVRLYNEKSSKIRIGDIIKFKSVNNENKYVLVKVKNLIMYENVNRVVRKLKMWYNLSARYERRKLESSLYGVTLIHI